jgi:hypothetical protein
MFSFMEHISWLLILKYHQRNVLTWLHVKYGRSQAIALREYRELALLEQH